jgi:hypothetical protein
MVSCDIGRAVHWYSRAADHGFAPAKNALGSLYERGNGVAQDKSAALHWYQLAAEQADPEALLNLTRVYAVDGIVGRAYFWGSIAMHNSSHPQALEDVVVNLRAHLSNADASRLEAEVADWLQMHPLRQSNQIDFILALQPKPGGDSSSPATVAKGSVF